MPAAVQEQADPGRFRKASQLNVAGFPTGPPVFPLRRRFIFHDTNFLRSRTRRICSLLRINRKLHMGWHLDRRPSLALPDQVPGHLDDD